MPIFEHNYRLRQTLPDGRSRTLAPQAVLQQLGPILRVTASVVPEHAEVYRNKNEEAPVPIEGYAIIDTGASVTCVDERVCKGLKLTPTGAMPMSHAGGAEMRLCYPIQLLFPGTPLPSLKSYRVMSCNLEQTNYIVLFGRDLLVGMKLVYNGPAGRIELAY